MKYQPRLPYPAKVKKDKQDEKFKEFLDMFKAMQINVPFMEAMVQMPQDAKVLKDF